MKENNLESAPNTEASKQSGTRCRLLCNPQSLPIPLLPRTRAHREQEETKEIRRQLKEYFWLQRFRKPTKTRRER